MEENFDYKQIISIFENQAVKIDDEDQHLRDMRENFERYLKDYKDLEKTNREKEELLLQKREELNNLMQPLRAFIFSADLMNKMLEDIETNITSTENNILGKKLKLIDKLELTRKNLTEMYSQFDEKNVTSAIQELDRDIQVVTNINKKTEAQILEYADQKKYSVYSGVPNLNEITNENTKELEQKLRDIKTKLQKSCEKIASCNKILANLDK